MSSRATGLPDARELLHRFVEAARRAGFRVDSFGEAPDGAPLLVARRSPMKPVMSVYVSAGTHGDEPAGPLALLHWLARGMPDPGVAWTVFPLLNPTGWDAGTRENAAGADLNRDYQTLTQTETRAQAAWLERECGEFDWAACLHEDWEASGFYLYEVARPGAPRFGRRILQEVSAVMPLDTASEIDGMPARRGLITPDGDHSLLGTAWPEALRLIRHHAPACHTFETPTGAPLARRMAAHVAALRAGLAESLSPRVEDDFVI